MDTKEIAAFLDSEGRLTAWPAKTKRKLVALAYLAERIQVLDYSEVKMNEELRKHHTFNDPALLRRELYMKGYIDRTPDGSRYWKMAKV